MNRGRLEIVEVDPGDRGAEPLRGELVPVVCVKGKDGVMHGGYVNHVVRSAGNLDTRCIERRALKLAIHLHDELLVKLVGAGAYICRGEDRLCGIRTRAVWVVAPLRYVYCRKY